MRISCAQILAPALLAIAAGVAAHTNEHGIDARNFDARTPTCGDFFQHANGGWLASNPIPAEYSTWSLDNEIGERNTAPASEGKKGGRLPLNTNGGGLSYMHSGMYGMYALQESVRQMRGIAPAQVEGAKISVCHGVGGMFAASGTVIFSNEA